jgi:hypothetical protein
MSDQQHDRTKCSTRTDACCFGRAPRRRPFQRQYWRLKAAYEAGVKPGSPELTDDLLTVFWWFDEQDAKYGPPAL